MKKTLKKLSTVLLALSLSTSASADLASCTNLSIAKLEFFKSGGFHRFSVVQNPSDASGSNWIYFTGWDKEDVRVIYSTLLAAKMGGNKIYLETEAASKCGLETGAESVLTRLQLQHRDY